MHERDYVIELTELYASLVEEEPNQAKAKDVARAFREAQSAAAGAELSCRFSAAARNGVHQHAPAADALGGVGQQLGTAVVHAAPAAPTAAQLCGEA